MRKNGRETGQICAEWTLTKQANHFTKIVNDAGKCQKTLFKIANEMLDKTKERVLPSYDDPKKLADEFNHFYINKVTKIRDSIPETTDKSYYARPFTGEMMTKFKIVTEEEVEKLIKSNGIKTCMEDPIPAKLLQQ